MKREPKRLVMTMASLMLGCGVALAAESAHQERTAVHSVAKRARHTAVRVLEATRHGIERGAEATVHGVKRAAQATGYGVQTGAHAVGRIAHRLADKF